MGIAIQKFSILVCHFLEKILLRTLLPQLRLSLLDRRNNHVTNTSSGKTVQASTSAVRFDKEEGLRAAVVSAVEDGSRWETHGHTELVARGTGGWKSRRKSQDGGNSTMKSNIQTCKRTL